MSYRVEVASSGRAGCQSTDCKKEKIKIGKDELRLGTWVDIPDRGGSWRWRHWGCVTGKIIQNIRQALDNNGSGKYCWEALDGYQGEDEKNSLHNHPDLQAKVQRVITQGFIDPEDFRGDPEMNKLGSTGLRSAASKKKMKLEQDKSDAQDLTEYRNQLDALKAERSRILSKGGSPSKIDIQLKIVQKALDESEKAEAPLEKQEKTKKKPGRKRAHVDNESDTEEPENHEEQLEKPVKKKRISARDKKPLQEVTEAKPELKVRGKKIVQKGVEVKNLSDGLEKKNKASKTKETSGKVKEENEMEEEGRKFEINDVKEINTSVKPKRGRPRKTDKKKDN